MARSQQSFNKKEREKKRKKKRKEKLERREQRKKEREETGKKTFEEQLSYVDEDGNLTSTPPDPTKKTKINAEEIVLGIPKKIDEPEEKIRKGKVKFFNMDKGYGFIIDSTSNESIFVHINDLSVPIMEGNLVSFEIEKGHKGPKAVRISHIK